MAAGATPSPSQKSNPMSGPRRRILALQLHGRQFGYAVLEDDSRLLDWGVKSFREGVNAARTPIAHKLQGLFRQFDPDVVVIRKSASPQAARVAKQLRMIAKSRLQILPNSAIENAFSGCTGNKHKIAVSIADRFSELLSRLPKQRKPWQSEDYRFSIFDAVAIGLAYQARSVTSEGTPNLRQ